MLLYIYKVCFFYTLCIYYTNAKINKNDTQKQDFFILFPKKNFKNYF